MTLPMNEKKSHNPSTLESESDGSGPHGPHSKSQGRLTFLTALFYQMEARPVIALGIVVLFMSGTMLIPILVRYVFGLDYEKSGQLGDSFAITNTLFSGLAFAGIILTILLQSYELQLQRDELAEGRKAQEASAEALRQQADLMAKSARITALSGRIQRTIDAIRQAERDKRDSTSLRQRLEQFNGELDKILDSMNKSD